MRPRANTIRPTAATALSALLATALLLPASATSRAADAQPQHPPLMPTQDATVTYEVTPGGARAPRAVTVSFGMQGAMMRVDAPVVQGQSQGYAVIDRLHRTVLVVMNPQHAYIELGARDDMHNPFLLDATMGFTRTGTATIAGQPCTTWRVTAGTTSNTTACVTDSGILLSENGVDSAGVHGQLVATSVSLAPIPAATFAPPPGFTQVAHTAPAAGPGSGPGPGPGPGPGGPNLGPAQAGPMPPAQ